ncbi:MAG: hypothetical protein Q7J85_07065 [Bacillota bacterium]|nr:hypothetical protein [Bacillota bacterium]
MKRKDQIINEAIEKLSALTKEDFIMGTLSNTYNQVRELSDQAGMAVRSAKSMEIFAGGDETFNIGKWREWKDACQKAGETISPSAFK